MRKIHVDNAQPGIKVAKTIFTNEGRVLLTPGTELKTHYIEKLRAHGITEFYAEDEVSGGIEIEDVICEETRQEAKAVIKNLMTSHIVSRALNTGKIKEIIGKIIDDLLNNKDILINLSDIKSVDDYTFEHSVNVCILSLIIGIDMGFEEHRLRDLGVGAILHDVGKLRISEELLKKPSELSVEEFEEIKKHTIYGYEILKNSPNISMISAFIAFGHHERYDGSGYPLQLRGENIHQCARIVAIADVYDALTSDRVYRKKLRPHEVVEYITSLGTHHYDKEIVSNFIKYIAVYPLGSGVLLNTKEKGIVVWMNKDQPTRPVIRVVLNERNERVSQFYDIDLSKRLNVHIVDACEL